MNTETKKKHAIKLQVERNKRYKESHNLKQVKIEINAEKYNAFNSKLLQLGMTKKEFIENAIDEFLKERIWED